VTVLANVPSKYLLRRVWQAEAAGAVVGQMHAQTGFHLGGNSSPSVVVERASFSVEATYVLTNADNEERVWTGSWRNTLGQLQPYQPLVHWRQLVTALSDFGKPGAIEAKLANAFGPLDTQWTYAGLVSIVFVIQLCGRFGPMMSKQQHRLVFLD